MQIAAAGLTARTTTTDSRSGARYGGYLTVDVPVGHRVFARDPEGDPVSPKFVVTGPALRSRFASLTDAIAAAQRVSAGARDAVAVVRDPGTGATGPWTVERLLATDFWHSVKYAPIDLEGVVTRVEPDDQVGDVYQTLGSQQSVIIGAVVDGALVLDQVRHYTSTRPDLPGRDPDRPKA